MKQDAVIIKGIMITEKSTALAEKENKYFFKVNNNANKIEIKKAVEKNFNVSVATVNTACYDGKKKRTRDFRIGKRPDWKKAVVTLKKGSRIELT